MASHSTQARSSAQSNQRAIDFGDKRAVVVQYTPYVRSIANKVRKNLPPNMDPDDLVEYGMIGLLEASERFDPEAGTNFMTFAYYRIRGAIYDGLRSMGWLSRSAYAKARYEERANQYLSEVAFAEVSGEAAPANPFEQAVDELAKVVEGLAAVYLTTIDGTEGLQLEDSTTPSPDVALGADQARSLVRKTVAQLSDQERQLLEMYYYKEMSLHEVGQELGLSKSWTSRLHARIIEKMKRLLDKELGP